MVQQSRLINQQGQRERFLPSRVWARPVLWPWPVPQQFQCLELYRQAGWQIFPGPISVAAPICLSFWGFQFESVPFLQIPPGLRPELKSPGLSINTGPAEAVYIESSN
jgi:hypothetical protein